MYIVQNMSAIDRIIGLLVGLTLTNLGHFYGDITHYIGINIFIGILALIYVLSIIISISPIYRLLKINNYKNSNHG